MKMKTKAFLVSFLIATGMAGMVVLTAALIYAEPFLVCDPAPAEEYVDGYVLSLNGDETEHPSPFKYDLADLPEGTYEVALRAKSIWGVSEPSVINFRKAVPVAPSGMALSAE